MQLFVFLIDYYQGSRTLTKMKLRKFSWYLPRLGNQNQEPDLLPTAILQK